jgi:hypothetical protein
MLVLLLLCACGCGHEPIVGPENFETTPLTGQVRLLGRPIGKGWIELSPIDGTTGHLRAGRLNPDGSFVIDRAPVGRVAARLVGTGRLISGDPTLDGLIERYRQVSLIRIDVDRSRREPVVLDLETELTRALREAGGGG